MNHFPSKHTIAAGLTAGLLTFAPAAHADPITAATTLLAVLGTQTATALAIAAVSVGLAAGSFLLTKLLMPGIKAQDRQASVASLAIGENPREMILGIAATAGTLAERFAPA